MPVLDNPRHEAFAQARAKLETADQAYQTAGFREHRGNAARLSTKEFILARVAELAKASESATTLTIRERREICAAIARNSDEDANVRIAATIAEAKHAQEFTERTEASIDDKRTLTAEQAAQRLAQVQAERLLRVLPKAG